MQDRLMTKTSDYYYDLPQELIAQTPLERRDSSRLMVLNKETGEISHHVFTDIIDYLNPGDVLAVNNSRVMPCNFIYGFHMGQKFGKAFRRQQQL